MKLAVICPLSRKDARLLLANVARQTRKDFALVVIESRSGIGGTQAVKLRPSALVQSTATTPGAARNAGLDIARAIKATHAIWFDDDDYYGPAYVAEAAEALATHRVVGKCAHFTALESRNIVLRGAGDIGDIRANRAVSTVPGCTLAHEIWDGMPRFDESLRFGEDTQWCADVAAAGESIWATSPFNFCYVRRGLHHGHTYPVRDKHLLAFSRGETYDVGAVGHNTSRLIDSGDIDALRSLAVLRNRVELTAEDEAEYERLTGPAPATQRAEWEDADGPAAP